MKKILIVAIVAIGIMACEKNGPSTPEKEKEVFKSVTVDAIALIGQDQAAIEKRLADAGMVICQAKDVVHIQKGCKLERF